MGRHKKKGSKGVAYAVRTKIRVNKKYKDTIFRMLFNNKKALLSLYNAINGSSYSNPDDLEITTIGDAIYMGYKNDVSFLIDNYMNLYEAQSTRNPNMPLRGLIYFGQVYEGYAQQYGLDIYADNQVKLPTPRYIVLYNGTKYEPERREYRLSDAFIHEQSDYCLECIATVLNINAGYNEKLMNSCRLLYEYAEFVAIMRKHLEGVKDGLNEIEAVNAAIEECIQNGILAEFLSRHSGEVRKMILTVYDEERHIKNEKILSYDQGKSAGKAEGKAEGEAKKLIRQVLIKHGKNLSADEIAEALEEDLYTIQVLCDIINANPNADEETIYELFRVQ